MKLSKRRIQLFLTDSAVICVTYIVAVFLTLLDTGLENIDYPYFAGMFVLLFCCIMAGRITLGMYSNVWRYANVTTYLRLVCADILGGILFALSGRLLVHRQMSLANAILVIMAVMCSSLTTRFLYQFVYARNNRNRDVEVDDKEGGAGNNKINIAIVGAGNIGAALAEELLRNPKAHYYPYCFIDNDKAKVGNVMNGIPIYEENEQILDFIRSLPIQEIVIALPDSTPENRTRLYNFYKQTDCKVKTYDYPVGANMEKYGKRTFREFRIEDLLFRDTLKVAGTESAKYYHDKVILVTGGGGSIGSELCRQIATLHPKRLVILDIYENNAYDIQQELIRKYHEDLNLETVIASVRDVRRLEEIFQAERPDIVFHAAAHKHVPLMEHSGCEAIKNNVVGTYNVANMAEKYGVEKFLLISTDKAVNPTNIMGASKRLCEMVIQCRTNSKTAFTAVRFGNVLGSNGSVIPLFKSQIEAGGPITLTDKRIIRYFMTIPEAVGLVMEAAAMAHNGEVYVLDMGKPVKILELAENMIRLSGLKPYEDIDIQEIGLRPGEKLYEELLMKTEELDKTSNDLIFIERDKGLTRDEVDEKIHILMESIDKKSYEELIHAIEETVPTYHNPDEINNKAEAVLNQ